MSSIIKLSKLDETWLRIDCPERFQELDIQDKFSFKVDNQFDPRIQKGHWDGVKKLYNLKTHKFPLGLLLELLTFLDQQDFEYELDPKLLPDSNPLELEDIQHLVNEIIVPKDKEGNPIHVADFQFDALLYILNMGRSVCLSATSSGKSLIIYLAVRIYQLMEDLQDKTLCITVPSITLVNQMWSDFNEYSQDTDWNVESHCQRLGDGRSKLIQAQIIITTWQTQCKLAKSDLERVGCIFVDECHLCSAKTLTQILQSLTECEYKHGLTGTLDGVEVNELSIQGLLGPVKVVIKAKEIMDIGFASKIKVNLMLLNHNVVTQSTFQKFKRDFIKSQPKKKKGDGYRAEIEFLNCFERRQDFILDFVESLEGNTLVLFDRVTTYGDILYEKALERHPDRTLYITGKIGGKEREEIRIDVENYDKCSLWCSFGTMSTGVSINKLHNCVLISSSKSKIRILQTIGRMMRKHESKDYGNIYDLVDNLGCENFMMTHAQKRIEYYMSEKFELEFIELDL